MPDSVAEAKIQIKELKLKKKELQGFKREFRASIANERAKHRRVVEETRPVREDKGFFNTFKSSRAANDCIVARNQKERIVSSLEGSLTNIENRIKEVDRQIIALERYILEQQK